MRTHSSFILKTMNVIFWIIFIGLCIKAGTILFSYIISMVVNPVARHNLYMGLNLSDLYDYSIAQYSLIMMIMLVLAGMKAYIGYGVVQIFMEMKMEKPFSEGIHDILIKISRIALWAGLLAIVGQAWSKELMKKDLDIPINWSSGELLFFAGVIYVIALVFQKGMELQSENELTI
jgi:hypothetical protein